MHNYLDIMHEDHESENRMFNSNEIPSIEDCIHRHGEVADILYVLFDDKINLLRSKYYILNLI